MTDTQSTDTREQWLLDFIDMARPVFAEAGHPIPVNLRVSIGFTSTGSKSSRIAEYWPPAASDDAHGEIFISPTTQTDARIADCVTHELIHATGIVGHGADFRALATAVGLTGPMRATVAGEGWYRWAAPILSVLGPMPYAAIKAGMKSPHKTKKTYLLKVDCPDCGWLARVTAAHCLPQMDCPSPDCDGSLTVHI